MLAHRVFGLESRYMQSELEFRKNEDSTWRSQTCTGNRDFVVAVQNKHILKKNVIFSHFIDI